MPTTTLTRNPELEPTDDVRLECAGRTAPGQRKSNDDHFMIGDLGDGLRVALSSVPGLAFEAESGTPLHRPVLMVADGVSGQPGATTASATTICAVAEGLEHLTMPVRTGAAVDAVDEALRVAGRSLRARAESSFDAPASSSTIAVVDWPHVDLVHVGHSRCYLLREGRLRRLTMDHTMAEELRRIGCKPGPAMSHVLTRAIGASEQAPDHRRLELATGDTLLVASNGLTETLDDCSLGAILGSRPKASAPEHCDELFRSVFGADAVHHNVTVVVLTAR
jgi:serine/threonine protein phosphatase PrpC